MNVTEQILDIIDKKIKCIFIENGCGGNPIAANILKIPRSSSVVQATLCLYDEDINREFFEISENKIKRAISEQYVYEVALSDNINNFIKQDTKYIISTSFVLNAHTEDIVTKEDAWKANHVSTHGYICIYNIDTNIASVYHVSLHYPNTREENIKLIGEIGIKILHDHIFKTNKSQDCFVDNVSYYDKNIGERDIHSTLEYMYLQNKDHVMYFSSDNKELYRIEDLMRSLPDNNTTLTILKGSFNPLQFGHIELLSLVTKHSNSAKGVFAISVGNRDKNTIEIKDLISKINSINKLGYDVLIFKDAFYKSNNDLLNNKFKNHIIYAIGADTAQRLLDDCNKTLFNELYGYSQFYYLRRDNFNVNELDVNEYAHYNMFGLDGNDCYDVSSTKVRDLITKLRDLVPLSILKDYVNNL